MEQTLKHGSGSLKSRICLKIPKKYCIYLSFFHLLNDEKEVNFAGDPVNL
jgi:hypothetical protein